MPYGPFLFPVEFGLLGCPASKCTQEILTICAVTKAFWQFMLLFVVTGTSLRFICIFQHWGGDCICRHKYMKLSLLRFKWNSIISVCFQWFFLKSGSLIKSRETWEQRKTEQDIIILKYPKTSAAASFVFYWTLHFGLKCVNTDQARLHLSGLIDKGYLKKNEKGCTTVSGQRRTCFPQTGKREHIALCSLP